MNADARQAVVAVSERSEAFDRRPAGAGDQRRAALLAALDGLLRERGLDEITVADLTRRAGVTRPAFYFYFENIAACVAALGVDLYQDAVAALQHLFAVDVPPRERIGRMIEELLETRLRHHYLYRASLDAARRSSALRGVWDQYRESFVEPVTALIIAERASGQAPPEPDAGTLAVMLLDLSDRALERLEADDPEGTARVAEALTTIWVRAVYGTDGTLDRR